MFEELISSDVEAWRTILRDWKLRTSFWVCTKSMCHFKLLVSGWQMSFNFVKNSDALAVIAWSNAQGKSKRQHPSLAGRLGQWMNGIFYQSKKKLPNIHPMCFPALCYIRLLVSVNRGPTARPKARASTTSMLFIVQNQLSTTDWGTQLESQD